MVFTRLQKWGQHCQAGISWLVPGISKCKPHFAHIHQEDNSSSCFASSFSHNMLPLKPPPASLLHASMHSAVFQRQLFSIRISLSHNQTFICTHRSWMKSEAQGSFIISWCMPQVSLFTTKWHHYIRLVVLTRRWVLSVLLKTQWEMHNWDATNKM